MLVVFARRERIALKYHSKHFEKIAEVFLFIVELNIKACAVTSKIIQASVQVVI